MLYDPKWQKPEVKADPLTFESLIAWLETKPASKTYCWADAGACLLAQYAEENGLHFKRAHYAFDDRHNIAFGYPRTFGAALDRARKALASRVPDGGAGRS